VRTDTPNDLPSSASICLRLKIGLDNLSDLRSISYVNGSSCDSSCGIFVAPLQYRPLPQVGECSLRLSVLAPCLAIRKTPTSGGTGTATENGIGRMSAEGMPQRDSSLLARPLAWMTRQIVRTPVAVVVVAVAAAVLALLYSASRLGFHTSRLDLLNPESSYNQLWIEYINEFGDADDVVVVVEGESRQQVVPVLEEISKALTREDRLFRAILHEVDLSKIRSKGLHYLNPKELLAIERFLDEAEPIVRGDWARLKLGNITQGMCMRLNQGAAAADPAFREAAQAEVSRLSRSLLEALRPQSRYQSPWPEMPCSIATLSELNSEYLLTCQGRIGFVLLQLAKDDSESFARGSESIDALRDLISQAQAAHPETKIGLTGLPVMENDEMRLSQSAMMKASLLALFGVACLFVAGFGGLRHPLMTVAALLLALGWCLGYVTLAVGHLNILSISFGVILIGLGIDFGVHYVARYLQLRSTIRSSDEALAQTASGVGPGILTGAVTTAIAFFMAGMTEFTGVAELGLIAGGGILLCCLGALVVLPAMIHLSDANHPNRVLPAPLDIHAWLSPLFSRPVLLLPVLVVTGAATALLSLGISRLTYDHNLLNLQPAGLESVELERRLGAEGDRSVWFALSIADSREELLRRKERFLALGSVERVEEIVSFFPPDDGQKRPIIARIQRRLADLAERPPLIPSDPPEQLGRVLGQVQASMVGSPRAFQIGRELEQVRAALRSMPLSECYRRLSTYQHHMAGDLLSRLHNVRTMANPEPPQLADLPQSLVQRFVGKDGNKFLLQIYSRRDIWKTEAAMERFVADVRSVDPRVTGNPLQAYEASRQMKRSYIQAAWYALAAILLVLYLDFRSLRHTLLAMLPVGLGMLQLFGILGILKVALNPANMIVLPLILGIGIDDGVHVVHDFRRRRGPYRISASTASAVVITSLTSMVGFGSLMIASHRGLQSLGRVLTIGVSCCLFTSLVMLPALLAWLTRARAVPEVEDPQLPQPAKPVRRIWRADPAHPPGAEIHVHSKSDRLSRDAMKRR
jgi:hopanoid biosynthesis associated RND transporter like protein HpnN